MFGIILNFLFIFFFKLTDITVIKNLYVYIPSKTILFCFFTITFFSTNKEEHLILICTLNF